MPSKVTPALARAFGLDPEIRLLDVRAGANSTIVMFEAASERFCARGRSPQERSALAIDRECRIAHYLVARGFSTPAILRTPTGEASLELAGRRWSVSAAATGEDRYGQQSVFTPFATLGETRSAGAMLARFHLELADFPEPHRAPSEGLTARYNLAFESDLRQGLEIQIGDRPELVAFLRDRPELAQVLEDFDDLRQGLQSALSDSENRGLPSGWIHGDWIKRNLFFVGQDVSAVLDFDLTCLGPWAFDLALAVSAAAYPWGPLREGAEPRLDHAEAMVAAYDGVRTLTAREREALPILLSTCRFEFHVSLIGTLLARGRPEEAQNVWSGQAAYLRWWRNR